MAEEEEERGMEEETEVSDCTSCPDWPNYGSGRCLGCPMFLKEEEEEVG